MKHVFPLIAIMFILISCGDNEPDIQIDNPIVYDFNRNGQSTVSFSGQTTRILMATELINSMMDFDKSSTELLEMFANQTISGSDVNPFQNADLNASTKSIKSKVAASSDFFSSNTTRSAEIKADFENWIISQANELQPNQNVLAERGTAGQIADGSSVRYINSKGLEYDQAVNKGLIGALMVDQIINNYLSTSVLDAGSNREENDLGTTLADKAYTNMEHKWDEAYGYLFGGASNTIDPLTVLGEGRFLNKYLARVEGDTDFAGIADDIWQAFKLGRAAIVAGDYTVRDEQAEIIRSKIADVIGVRAIYYLQNGKTNLTNGSIGPAFHDLSEGFGFIYSLQFLRVPNSNEALFSSAEVDGYISQLTAGNGFWDLSSETLDQISEDIADKFDFTVEQAAE